jgi:hypothetical protein
MRNKFILPDWVDAELWAAYEESRKKHPMTDYARRLAIRKLEEIYRATGDHPSEVLEQSILCGYRGLFPVNRGFRQEREDELRKELNTGAGPKVS